MPEETILVSLIVPILNEETFIESCVRSLRAQDIPAEQMEILLLDGQSTDGTPEILSRLAAEDPAHIRVIPNPGRIQSAAMNLGARNARGKYLVRIDAHAEYPANYVSTCIRMLEEKQAVNAGCSVKTVARTDMGKVIAMLMTSPFGVGGSQFRTGAKSGYVDTVPFGTFRKDDFLRLGGFDERLTRNEDNEFNNRILQSGGKIYMTSRVQSTYYCRETAKELGAMAFANGKWAVIAAKICPGCMSVKYFVPLLFTLSLVGMPVLSCLWGGFAALFGLELAAYGLLALLSALQKTRRFCQLVRLICLFPLFHICYGAGSLAGFWALIRKKT